MGQAQARPCAVEMTRNHQGACGPGLWIRISGGALTGHKVVQGPGAGERLVGEG